MVSSRKIDVFSLIIVVIFSVLSIIAITGSFNQFEFKYIPYYPSKEIPENYDATSYGHRGYLLPEHDPPLPTAEHFGVRFKASSISAQNPITVIAELDLLEESISDDFKNKYNTHGQYLALVFPNAYKYDPWNPFSNDLRAFIPFEPTEKPDVYKAEGQIIYPFSGEFGYFLMSKDDRIRYQTPDGGFKLSEMYYRMYKKPIVVESASVTASIQANNIFLTLTFIATAIGSIQILHYYSNRQEKKP